MRRTIAVAALAIPPFIEALGTWLGGIARVAFWLLICLLIASVPIFVVYGTMFALSRIAGRIRRGRESRP
jgi:hypothetical protein